MADYIRKQIDVDGSYIFPYTHADAVLYTTQNNLDGITSGTETNVKAVLDALDNTYRRLDSNILSLYNPLGKRGFLYLNGTTTTASMELPTLGNNFYVPTLKYDSSGNITTAWQTPASIAAAADLSGYLPLTGGTLTGDITVTKSSYSVLTGEAVVNGLTVKSNNITVGFGIGTGGVNRGIYDYNNNKWLIYSDGTNTNLPLGNVNISGDTKVTGKVMVGTGAPNSYLGSTSATNIFLNNSSGSVLVCDAKVVRRGTAVSDVDLGSTTYPWRALYATTIYENGTAISNKYLLLSGGTLTGTLNLDSNTMGAVPHILFNRANFNYLNVPTNGTLAVSINGAGGANTYLAVSSTAVYPGYHDKTIDLGTSTYPWLYLYTRAIRFSSSEINTAASGSRLSVGTYNQSAAAGFNVGDLLVSSAWSDYTNVPTNGIYVKGNIRTAGNIQVGTGGANSYVASDSATNIYLKNSSGAILVCDGLAVRRGTTLTNATLGTSTYPWLALYATTVYENGTSLASKYLALSGGTMTGAITTSVNASTAFDATKGINFGTVAHMGASSSGLGIFSTGGIWFRPGLPSLTEYDGTYGLLVFPTTLTYNGINVSLEGHTHSEYLSTSGTAAKATSLAGGALGSIPYQSAAGTTSFLAAGTNGYILSYNTTNQAPEWVVKPTSNVTTSAVVSSSATGTTQITAAQSNPYYNLIEGSSVARSIRFVAGTGISISAATDGQITFTNTGGSGGSTTVSSILASTSTGTSAISGDTLDPYYNLLVNSAVNSSVLYKAGTNMAITADTNNVITFNNTLNTMSKLTNDLFINGTLTAATGSWKGNLPAGITALYNGLTIFYRLPYAGSGNASLLLYAPDGTTAIGANCPVYGGNTRLTTHYPLYSIIPMTYYNGEWRANPYYNTNSYVTQTNSATTDYRPLLLGSLSNATYTSIPTTAVTNSTYKSSNLVYSPNYGRIYMTGTTADTNHGYYVKYSTTAFLGLCIGTDGVQIGLRDAKNGTWLCYCDDGVGESLKVPGTLIPLVINLAEHCLIAYDSTNQCINFTFT